MKRGNEMRKTELAVRLGAAGAVAAGIVGCDTGTICDPPPPPLCDSLDVDPSLAVIADRMTATVDEIITFTATVDTTAVDEANYAWIEGDAGQVVGSESVSPGTIRIRWKGRGMGGKFQAGSHTLELSVGVSPKGERSCYETGDIVVMIDEQGTVTVESLPGPSGLGSYFEIRIHESVDGDGIRLTAVPTLPEAERSGLAWRWRASSGELSVDGPEAIFVPDPNAGSTVVQVEARRGDRGLAVGSWHLRRE